MAVANIEVYTFGGMDIYYNVFQGIKLLIGNGSYVNYIKIIMLVGFVLALISYMIFKHDFKRFIGYTFTSTFVFFAAVSFPTDVTIIDTHNEGFTIVGYDRVKLVQRVPLLPAFLAGVFSQLSYGLTNQIDNIFSFGTLTGAQTVGYLQSGLGGAQKGFDKITRFNLKWISHPELRKFEMFIEDYLTGCYFPDLMVSSVNTSQTKFYEAESVLVGLSPIVGNRLVEEPADLRAAVSGSNENSTADEIVTCSEFYSDLTKYYESKVKPILFTGDPLFGTPTLYELLNMHPAEGMAAVKMADLASGSEKLENCVMNTGLYQAFNTTLESWSVGAGDTTTKAMLYAIGKQRENYWIQGKSIWTFFLYTFPKYVVASQAILIFLSPVVFLLLFLPGSSLKILGGYAMGLLAVFLYDPIAATINGFANIIYFKQLSLGVAVPLCSPHGLNEVTAGLQDWLAVFGMMSMGIPGIALFLTSGSAYAFLRGVNMAGMTGTPGQAAAGMLTRSGGTDIYQDVGTAKAANALGMNTGDFYGKTAVAHQLWEMAKNRGHMETFNHFGVKEVMDGVTYNQLKGVAEGLGYYKLAQELGWDAYKDMKINATANREIQGLQFYNKYDRPTYGEMGDYNIQKNVADMERMKGIFNALGGAENFGNLKNFMNWYSSDKRVVDENIAETFQSAGFSGVRAGMTLRDLNVDKNGNIVSATFGTQTGSMGITYKDGKVEIRETETLNFGGVNSVAQAVTVTDKDGNFIKREFSGTADGVDFGGLKVSGQYNIIETPDGKRLLSFNDAQINYNGQSYKGNLLVEMGEDGETRVLFSDGKSGSDYKELDIDNKVKERINSEVYKNLYEDTSIVNIGEKAHYSKAGLVVYEQDTGLVLGNVAANVDLTGKGDNKLAEIKGVVTTPDGQKMIMNAQGQGAEILRVKDIANVLHAQGLTAEERRNYMLSHYKELGYRSKEEALAAFNSVQKVFGNGDGFDLDRMSMVYNTARESGGSLVVAAKDIVDTELTEGNKITHKRGETYQADGIKFEQAAIINDITKNDGKLVTSLSMQYLEKIQAAMRSGDVEAFRKATHEWEQFKVTVATALDSDVSKLLKIDENKYQGDGLKGGLGTLFGIHGKLGRDESTRVSLLGAGVYSSLSAIEAAVLKDNDGKLDGNEIANIQQALRNGVIQPVNNTLKIINSRGAEAVATDPKVFGEIPKNLSNSVETVKSILKGNLDISGKDAALQLDIQRWSQNLSPAMRELILQKIKESERNANLYKQFDYTPKQ